MSIFGKIFDAFSMRPETAAKPKHVVPERTRTRILMLCGEVFGNQHQSSGYIAGRGNCAPEFWEEIHRLLRYRHGQGQFHAGARSQMEDALQFLSACPGEQFLDFVEDIFQVTTLFRVGYRPDAFVEDINALLRQDDLPYSLTPFVQQTARELLTSGPFAGGEHDVTRTTAFPRVIMRESEVLHANAIQPVLALLGRPEYRSANGEYLAALEDYRRDQFADCLTKCGSAFESVLKILCHRKGWKYDQHATVGPLVKIFLAEPQLDPYFDTMLMTTATLRNKLSASHGAGVVAKNVPRHVALYAVNVTASAILFVTQHAGEA